MDIIWAPWRMRYIMGEKEENCLFCLHAHYRSSQGHSRITQGYLQRVAKEDKKILTSGI